MAVVTRGSTYDNGANLPPRFVQAIRSQFARTALGRQELDGELLDEVEGALWSRALLEQCREPASTDAVVRIVAGTSFEPVVSASTEHPVRFAACVERIVSGSAAECISSRVAMDEVVSATARESAAVESAAALSPSVSVFNGWLCLEPSR